MPINEYLGLEQLIINKLILDVSELKIVSSWSTLFGDKFKIQSSPSAYIIYGGENVITGTKGNLGKAQLVSQRWIISLAVRDVSSTKNNEGVRNVASPILYKIFKSLSGEQLGTQAVFIYGTLTMTQAPRPVYSSGIGVFSLAFNSKFVIK